jgi:hypothetical protein
MTVATGKKGFFILLPCITHHTCLIQPLKMYRITAHAGMLHLAKTGLVVVWYNPDGFSLYQRQN